MSEMSERIVSVVDSKTYAITSWVSKRDLKRMLKVEHSGYSLNDIITIGLNIVEQEIEYSLKQEEVKEII